MECLVLLQLQQRRWGKRKACICAQKQTWQFEFLRESDGPWVLQMKNKCTLCTQWKHCSVFPCPLSNTQIFFKKSKIINPKIMYVFTRIKTFFFKFQKALSHRQGTGGDYFVCLSGQTDTLLCLLKATSKERLKLVSASHLAQCHKPNQQSCHYALWWLQALQPSKIDKALNSLYPPTCRSSKNSSSFPLAAVLKSASHSLAY